MKIRTDFVTNSSSSSFMTVRLTTAKKGEICFSADIDLEIPEDDEMLQTLLGMKSVEELMSYLKLSEEDCTYRSNDFSMENITIDDIEKIRVTAGYIPGEELWDILEDNGIDPEEIEDWESKETMDMLKKTITNLCLDWEGDYALASATEYDLKSKTAKEVPVEPDDTYCMI